MLLPRGPKPRINNEGPPGHNRTTLQQHRVFYSHQHMHTHSHTHIIHTHTLTRVLWQPYTRVTRQSSGPWHQSAGRLVNSVNSSGGNTHPCGTPRAPGSPPAPARAPPYPRSGPPPNKAPASPVLADLFMTTSWLNLATSAAFLLPISSVYGVRRDTTHMV